MVKDNVFWKKFEKSGKISDYLEYACTMVEADDYRNAVIGDPVPDVPDVILPGYDESFKLY